MKDYDKSKESSYLKYWDVNNLHGWAMPQQKLPVNNFAWIENTSEFNADLINIYKWRKSWRIFFSSWCPIYLKTTWPFHENELYMNYRIS